MTNKASVLAANPKARLDYYELLRGSGRPCWFIRDGWQGNSYTAIHKSPKAAWKEAADNLREAISQAGRDLAKLRKTKKGGRG